MHYHPEAIDEADQLELFRITLEQKAQNDNEISINESRFIESTMRTNTNTNKQI